GPFRGLYSLVAFAFFVPLVRTFFAHKHAGRWLWLVERGTGLRWAIYVGMGLAFVMLVASLVRPSPAGVVPGDPTPRGVYRITRHPLVMSIALFGALHLLPNGSTSDVAFFGGFVAFALVGAWHQDRRKLALGVPGFRAFYQATPFLPFTGRDALVAEHFAASYAGDTSKLPQVLGALLEPLRQLFASEGVQLDRQKLLTVIMVSAAKHRIAPPAELQAAFALLPP